MQRPKLEVASWIAGVIGALVTIVAFAYQLRQPTPAAADASPAAQPTAPASGLAASAPSPSTDALSDYRRRLRSGFEAAKRLNNYSDRDSAILGIVRSAVRDNYYMFAFEASRSINSYSVRDAVAETVTCHLAHRGEYEDAKTVALAINTYSVRDSSLRQISYLATVKPGEGENDYSCNGPMERIL